MPNIVAYTHNPSILETEQGNQGQFEFSLGYIVTSSQAWTTQQDPAIKKKKKKQRLSSITIIILR